MAPGHFSLSPKGGLDLRRIEVQRISTADSAALGEFFEALAADAETVRFFHPHPFSRAFAVELCGRTTACRDRYYVARYRDRIVAYMMLRGWDEGYAIPSFGVGSHPALRDAGLGQLLLAHAAAESRDAGASKLRLTVFKNNERAVHVYRKFGFVFQDKNEQELVGLLELRPELTLPVRPINFAKLETWFAATSEAA
jgi:ribosomal protein S18 acetylase RimI-like enzyme